MEYITLLTTSPLALKALQILALCIIGIPLVSKVSNIVEKAARTKAHRHISMLFQKIIYYGGMSIIVLYVLRTLGFNITALLGAAGVVGVAIGFASQTSMSNIISGIFLLLECPFALGDEIKFDETSGVVESINLFSITLRTLENTAVRVPNELLIKKHITNFSRLKERRLLVTATVAHETSLSSCMQAIQAASTALPFVTKDADIRIEELLSYASVLRIRVYVERKNLATAQQELLATIKKQLQAHNITAYDVYFGIKPTSAQGIHITQTTK